MDTEDLYQLSIPELNKMARDKGVRFKEGYNGPYSINKSIIDLTEYYKTCSPIDQNVEEERSFVELSDGDYDKKQITIYDIRCGQNYFRCARKKENAEKFAEQMNKRHFIIAMQSENPAFPVLI
jgi:hypothetical protein